MLFSNNRAAVLCATDGFNIELEDDIKLFLASI